MAEALANLTKEQPIEKKCGALLGKRYVSLKTIN